MANPLTGDHDAVVQVSLGTFNRLLATMHQNEGPGSYLPTLPHSAFVRVGDEPNTRVDGVQGVVRVQVGVPRLELVHLAQDRVIVHALLRNWFTPSSGSAPFPEFSYGALRAEFALLEIPATGSPNQTHGVYHPPRFRFDVDPTRVSFKSAGDTSNDAAITRQIVALMQMTFSMPDGHPMFGALMDKKLISLSTADGQAVAFALRLAGEAMTEVPSQVVNVLTAGKDFAVAAGGDYILSLLRPQLDALEATTTYVQVDVFFDTIVYTVDITSATAQWAVDVIGAGAAMTPCGALSLTINGKGTTTSSFPDGTFSITHRVLLGFDPATQSLFLLPKGGPNVQAHFGGIGIVESVIESEIETIYNAQLTTALAAATPQLAMTSGIKDGVAAQLQYSDDQAATTLDAAAFTVDGLVLRGTVSLAPRLEPIVQLGPLPDVSGYSAFLSWIPGGYITGFRWLWQSLPPLPGDPADPYGQDHSDRFVVQPDVEMPGLPRPSGGPRRGGRVCIWFNGLVVDPVTGDEVRAFAQGCISIDAPPPPPPPWSLIEVESVPVWWRLWAEAEVGIVDAGRGGPRTEPFNTLVYHVSRPQELTSLAAIVEGIDGAGRDDAGLLLLTVVPEGGVDETVLTRVYETAPQSDVAVRITDDLAGGWARSFRVIGDAEEALRLLTADGELEWSHDGAITAEALSAALREHLVPSAPPQFAPLRPEVAVGQPAPPAHLEPSASERLSLVHLRGRPVTLCFALSWSDSSQAAIRRLDDELAERHGLVAVVLTDADADEAATVARAHASELLVAPDPHRSITNAFGVYVWPTIITIDGTGIVTSVTTGTHPRHEEPRITA